MGDQADIVSIHLGADANRIRCIGIVRARLFVSVLHVCHCIVRPTLLSHCERRIRIRVYVLCLSGCVKNSKISVRLGPVSPGYTVK